MPVKTDLRVMGYYEVVPLEANCLVLDVTSRSTGGGAVFSPFFLGPIRTNLEDCQNLENYWQYSKVYEDQVDDKGDPTPEYWEWRRAGFAKTKADRYPKGKGVIPKYSIDRYGKKFSYIEARKAIYVPWYAKLVREKAASGFFKLKGFVDSGICRRIQLMDFDGYDHVELGMSIQQVIEEPNRKMGHALVLWGMLMDQI